ncbi:hypothetical protein CJ030_MR6G010290 [Morella rubra]|uniref:Uncharacterized protein n=1 Tax=Morella rubra TaxID=262757 RepID=A0A6A1VEJ5_9ROSI|nr:hypothetical protein CJ030_MR6G010290 [Morella rubra]
MRLEVKRHGLLLGLLVLSALLLASSLFITSEKMGKLTSSRDGEEILFGAVALKQRKLWTYDSGKLREKRPARPPPPAPRGPKGPHP